MQVTVVIICFRGAAFRALAHINNKLFGVGAVASTHCTGIQEFGTSAPFSTLTLSPTLSAGAAA